MKKRPTLLSIAVSAACAAALPAQSFSFGFESLDSLTESFDGAGSTWALSSSTGVTEGASALEVTNGAPYWDFAINLSGSDFLSLAIALDASGGIAWLDVTSNFDDGNTGYWGSLSVHVQGSGISASQTPAIDIYPTDSDTIELDFSGVDFSAATGDWGQLNFAFNQNAGTTSYIDNLVVSSIPEPSALGMLVGLCAGLGLMPRRRR